jgi:hypothetical protein
MNYIILLHLLPVDIVHYIYKIIKNDSIKYLTNFIKIKKNKTISLRCIVYELFNVEIVDNNRKITLFRKFIYDNLKIIYYNNYRLIRDFWIHILNILSFKLNLIRNHIHINNLNNNNNKDYIAYKKFYGYWFNLCKKYNIKLLIIKKKRLTSLQYENLYIVSRKLNKIKSEINLFTFPHVLDDNFNQISIEDSQYYLLDF